MEKPEYYAAIAGRYCLRAKRVFSELNEKPFAVELDLRVLATRLVATISILSPHNIKSHKLLTYQLTEHNHLKTSNTISHNTKNRHSHVLFFSTTPNPNTNNPQNQTLSPSIPAELTPRAILDSVHSSQWHFIKHLAYKITPSLISTTLTSLHKTPDLAFQFVTHIGFRDLDIKSDIREVFNELGVARGVLGFKTYVLYDLLIRACCELKRGDDAFECFDMMKEKGVIPHVHACNDMLSLFLKSNTTEKAWVLYAEMFKLRIKSSVVTFNIMINVMKKAKEFIGFMEALGIKLNVEGARMISDLMKCRGVKPDSYTYGSFISGMCKEGKLEEASGMLEKMKEIGLRPNAVTYNTLIDGYCNKGNLEMAFGYKDKMMDEADGIIKEMNEKGLVPDSITYNILINGYCRCGNVKKAFTLHDEMISKGVQPTLFNALIDGHCANENMERAFALLKEMDQMKVVPDEVTFNTLLQGRCREGKVEAARELIEEMKSRGIKPDHISYNTLISGYSKRGDMKDAFRVRDEMLNIGFNPTLLTYNALIQGLCNNEEGDHAA
uniref:Pentacotripeptide-repeat region of PRORP domain-containing protein n=1 Tax=Salix viminalis TaxID=40686 RepID=A0A6N2LNS9_SALVM